MSEENKPGEAKTFTEAEVRAMVDDAVKKTLADNAAATERAKSDAEAKAKTDAEAKAAEELRAKTLSMDERVKQIESEKNELRGRLTLLEGERARATVEGFIEERIKEGKVLPTEKTALCDVLMALPADKAEAFRQSIKSRAKVIEYGAGSYSGVDGKTGDAEETEERQKAGEFFDSHAEVMAGWNMSRERFIEGWVAPRFSFLDVPPAKKDGEK